MAKRKEHNMPETEQPKQTTSAATHAAEDPSLEPTDPTQEEIAIRAYRCWQERGSGDGTPETDWNRAEQGLRAEKAGTGKARGAAASAQ
jgi:Protein of unknown function (DUF2934)